MSAFESINKFTKELILFFGVVAVSLILSFILDFFANNESIDLILAKGVEFLTNSQNFIIH